MSTSAVDLPIQRERHTNWPHIQASAVKGAFRAHYRRFNQDDQQLVNLIFGSDDQDGWAKDQVSLPGAISISDARLLAFPMRSNVAPFVWVTCPAVLKRLNTDFEYSGMGGFQKIADINEIKNNNALSVGKEKIRGQVVLEDAVANVGAEVEELFSENNFPELERLLIISDEMFDYAVSSCTEIQTHIKIDEKTGTAKEGALRYHEYLPADSVLYSIVHYSRRDVGEFKEGGLQKEFEEMVRDLKAETIKKHIEDVIAEFVQIGGDETLGKGICRLTWLNGGAQ